MQKKPSRPSRSGAPLNATFDATLGDLAGGRAARRSSGSLAELAGLRETLAQRAAADELQRRRDEEAARIAAADAELFRNSVGQVNALRATARATLPRASPPPLPLQTRRDEQAVLHEALYDSLDPEHLLDVDEALWYARPGISRDIVRKLRRGAWVVQGQLDLHGLRSDEAQLALAEFIRDACKRGQRCVRVIHGKGLGSANREPVLKGKVRAWLARKNEVLAYCEARGHDGGGGAVVVLLQPTRPAV